MIHAQFALDRPRFSSPVESPRPPKIVKLIMHVRDLEEPLSLTMYNVVREGIAAAGRVLARGGAIGIEVHETSGGFGWFRSICEAKEFEPWMDSVNRVVLLSHPVPRIDSLEHRARRDARLGLFPDAFEIARKPAP